MPPSAFWDTSALVPLCVKEQHTRQAQALHQQFEIVAWWGTQIEVASALARLLRMNILSPLEWTRASKTAAELAQAWTEVGPSETIRVKARRIVDSFDLRAGDAFQLAAALEWCEDTPGGKAFVTADRRLLRAAFLSGFDAKDV